MSDDTNLPIATKLARALQVLVMDLGYTSESYYPYSAFDAEMPRTTELTPESFRNAVGTGDKYVHMDAIDWFFEYYRDPQQSEPEEVAAYTLLEKVMRATLTDLRYVSVGDDEDVEFHVYFFGRTEEGNLAGLSSVAIRT